MIWNIPKIWEGGDCWILGGGPSLPKQFDIPDEVINEVRAGILPPSTYSSYMEAIHDKHVIGVNSAFKIGRWIDFITFGDKRWYINNREELLPYPKPIIAFNNTPNMPEFIYDGLKCVPRDDNKSVGISTRKNRVSWNKNTGYASINLAYHLGVKRVYLLGFDMKLDDNNKQHWHGLYPSINRTDFSPRKLPFGRHLPKSPIIWQDAQRLGFEIVNLSPDSAIKEFPKTTLKEVLKNEKS